MRLQGRLDNRLSRWLWLVKWILAIPHYVALLVLSVVFVVLTVIAWFAILFTGRYPRSLFYFNVGVLRWGWRVVFYAFVLGTDRYPPFRLASDTDYPADLQVDHPDRLSRGLVLVKAWLLAIPHWLVVSFFTGGGYAPWYWVDSDDDGSGWIGSWHTTGVGLIGLLAFFAGVVLLFRAYYPRSIFEFVMGLERWVYRVVGYVSLMRDEYPPFRLDQGGTDPGSPVAESVGAPGPRPAGSGEASP